jgi:zinc-ribbon domain
MKSKIGWILAIVFGLLLLLVLVFSGFLMGGRYWGHGFDYGSRMRWPGMMGGYYPLHPFGGGVVLFGCLIAVGIIILLIVGVVALVKSMNKPEKQIPPQQEPTQQVSIQPEPPQVESGPTCSNCGKPIQSDWSNCPYCGNKLSSDSDPQ